MAKTLVMHRIHEYGIEDVEDTITYPQLKELIGGWAEIAMKTNVDGVATLIPTFSKKDLKSYDGVMVFCDSDGHPKGLGLTWVRPWDNAPLVGKLCWVAYRNVVVDRSPDIELYPLPTACINAMINYLKQMGWGQLMAFDEKVAAQENYTSGGGLGEA